MPRYYSNSNKKANKKTDKTKRNRILIIVLSSVVLVSILCTLLFGLKLYAYGKDVTVIYVANGGKVSQEIQTVEVGKKYTLVTPTREGYTFLYWSTKEDGSKKVSNGGLWTASTESQVVLYAIWQSSYDGSGEDDKWTNPY